MPESKKKLTSEERIARRQAARVQAAKKDKHSEVMLNEYAIATVFAGTIGITKLIMLLSTGRLLGPTFMILLGLTLGIYFSVMTGCRGLFGREYLEFRDKYRGWRKHKIYKRDNPIDYWLNTILFLCFAWCMVYFVYQI